MTTEESTISPLQARLDARGVSRRTFLKFCGAIAVMAGLGKAAAPDVAQALEKSTSGKLLPVVWLELASCSGCTESTAQVTTPDIASVVLELISLNYSETLSAAAGVSLDKARTDTIAAGGYVAVIEGAVVRGWDGNGLRIGGMKGTDLVKETCEKADAVIAVGSCAVDGGWQAGYPNPADCCGVTEFLKAEGISVPIINIPTCPVNPDWLVAVLVDYIMLGKLPELDDKNMPSLIFGESIHDNCPRRGHFENGEFVYQFGSVEEEKGYCLYAVGCKGPQTYAKCPITRWNESISWCVEAGSPCIGCANADPTRTTRNWVDTMTPFLKRQRNMRIGDLYFQAAPVAATVTGIVAAALVCHGFGMKAAGRTKGGADFEPIRTYDAKKLKQAGKEAPTTPINEGNVEKFTKGGDE